LVVIINSLKYQKLKKKFTIWNEISCTKLQRPPEPLTRGLPPPDPRSLCPLSSTEFVDPPPAPTKKTQNSWIRHYRWQYSGCALRAGYLRLQTHTQNMQFLLLAHHKKLVHERASTLRSTYSTLSVLFSNSIGSKCAIRYKHTAYLYKATAPIWVP